MSVYAIASTLYCAGALLTFSAFAEEALSQSDRRGTWVVLAGLVAIWPVTAVLIAAMTFMKLCDDRE